MPNPSVTQQQHSSAVWDQPQPTGARQAELCLVRRPWPQFGLSWNHQCPKQLSSIWYAFLDAEHRRISLSLSPSSVLKPLICQLVELNLSNTAVLLRFLVLHLLLLCISAWVLPNLLYFSLADACKLIGFLVHSKTWGNYPIILLLSQVIFWHHVADL